MKKTKVNVLELNPGKGKAGALENLIEHFKLLKTSSKIDYIMIADADTVFSDNFLEVALPYFENPKVMAFSGFAKTRWDKTRLISAKRLFIGYRTRLYNTLQIIFMWGQTWRFTNVNPVIPGFASIYRSKALKTLKLDVPGLAIEDFNMAFQLHKKKLGIHAHNPQAVAVCQDPDNLRDYWKQIRRWNLGYFQTVRHYGLWPSFFWVSLGIFSLEVFFSSFFFLILPITTYLVFTGQYYNFIINNAFLDSFIDPELSLYGIYAVFVIDYLFTWVVAFLDKKPSLFFYGFFFFIIRYIDAIVLLISLPQGLLTKSSGRWTSPTRRK